uniref:Si:ch211-266i6.3 n=1 Tax=Labrus bergylta TaxID=56723 RepID=A0A3Q3F9H6_9LABR|nr:cytoskeleton-associated protein 2-like isoform X1 [Labrus bergylta]
MDVVTVSTRNYSKNKGNKENAQPTLGRKTSVKREKNSAPPFQLKSNKKEETLAKSGPLKAKEKQTDTRSTSGEALKKTVQRNVRGATVTEVKQRQTHSQAFLSEQAVRHKKMVAEAPKPPAAVTSSKPAPGTYKGRIVQSKIGSIWRSSVAVGAVDPKPSAPKTEIQRVGNVTKIRSKSAVDALGNGTQKPVPLRSVSEKPALVSKRPVTSRPPAGFRSARPPVRTIPATLTSTSTRNTKVAPIKASGGLNSKLKVSVTDRKLNKPPVSSTISQYRLNVESAEERRAKLATWQASKGKTFKRPAMTAAVQPKTKVSAKPDCVCGPKPQCQSLVKTRPAQASSIDPEPGLEAQNTWRAEVASHSQTPAVMNTTLDLLENSDDVFYGQQDGVDDIVVNLCDALEALATPSGCSDEVSQMTDVCREVEVENGNEDKDCEGEEELKDEGPENVSEQLKDEVEVDDVEEVESDEGVMETTPHKEDASVVKYSVKTTPYLQSVKKTIEGGEVSMSTSKRKSYIKDLKFLTPVRRSCRIERKSSHLPTMLLDHDPCVSSLAGLAQLDDDPNAYIFRKNPALLEELPDQPRM